jgi:ABC-type transport system involved in multi-copper enzyme maturation permease subunit
MTSEFSTGTIRSSLTAVPQRGRFYAAKTLTGALVAAVAAAVSVLAAFLSAQAGLGPYGTSLRADGAAQAAIGGVIYLVLIFLFATGLAALFRNAIPTLGILLPLQFLSSQGLGNLPKVKTVAQFLPGDAGMSILRIVGQDFDPRFARPYGPWGGLGIVALWAAAALIAGYFALRRREA